MDRKHSSLRELLGDLTIGGDDTKMSNSKGNDSIGLQPADLTGSTIAEDDEDVCAHSNLLSQLLHDTQQRVREETAALKKRLVEEKEVALMEAERDYLSKYDRYQSEINNLRAEVRQLQQANSKQTQRYNELGNRAATLAAGAHFVYRSDFSVKKIFDAWRKAASKTRDVDRIDRIGSSFSRKYILEKAFQTMCLNIQRKKNLKLQSDSKFKFDSVTNDMVTRYEAEIGRLSEDLKDAYLTVEHEQLRRQQLEEDLRRLFLKNMTAMNMEALTLFEHSHSNVQDVLASAMPNHGGATDSRLGVSHSELQMNSYNRQPSQIPSQSGMAMMESHQYFTANEPIESEKNQHEYEKLVASTFIQSPPILPPAPRGHQVREDVDETPRPPLNAQMSPSMTGAESPHTAALRTSSSNLLSELYRANMATTNRLAHMNNSNTKNHSGQVPTFHGSGRFQQ